MRNLQANLDNDGALLSSMVGCLDSIRGNTINMEIPLSKDDRFELIRLYDFLLKAASSVRDSPTVKSFTVSNEAFELYSQDEWRDKLIREGIDINGDITYSSTGWGVKTIQRGLSV